MTPHQIQLVKKSFELVEPIASQAADIFYERLFSVAPSVRSLFVNDLRKQGAMLMQAIGLAVRNLDNPESILSTLHAMGRRHVAYGAQPAHYDVVGDVLLWTLEKGLGDTFTVEVGEAWAQAYALLSGEMIRGAQKAAA